MAFNRQSRAGGASSGSEPAGVTMPKRILKVVVLRALQGYHLQYSGIVERPLEGLKQYCKLPKMLRQHGGLGAKAEELARFWAIL